MLDDNDIRIGDHPTKSFDIHPDFKDCFKNKSEHEEVMDQLDIIKEKLNVVIAERHDHTRALDNQKCQYRLCGPCNKGYCIYNYGVVCHRNFGCNICPNYPEQKKCAFNNNIICVSTCCDGCWYQLIYSYVPTSITWTGTTRSGGIY